MNIFITGSSGLVGTDLCDKLNQKNYSVYKLDRIHNSMGLNSPDWNLDISQDKNTVHANTFIHLAGENIAAKRWSDNQKKKIYESRILGTKKLVAKIIASPNKPKTFICASAIGYYGDRNQELLDENSISGENFVSKICKDWEQITQPLKDHGIRVVNLRFGVILSKKGGALKKMLIPFKLGLGGALGTGQQKFSWISLEDAIKAIIYIIEKPNITGPVNITSPNPVSNSVYTKTLAKTLNRPAFFDMPAFICRLLFGKIADELLLSSQSVMPKKLIQNGFSFSDIDIESALSKTLK
jgi:uncharacterized protein (TIGR01777 family)